MRQRVGGRALSRDDSEGIMNNNKGDIQVHYHVQEPAVGCIIKCIFKLFFNIIFIFLLPTPGRAVTNHCFPFQLEDEGALSPFHLFKELNKRIGIYSHPHISFHLNIRDLHSPSSFPKKGLFFNDLA